MIAGIDYSTLYVDLVLLDEDTDNATWHRYDLTGRNAFDRARTVTSVVPRAGHEFWDEILAVGIEDPRGYNTGVLYRVQGALLACVPQRTLVHPWLPSEWRKAVGLPGNCPKDAVKSQVITWAWESGSGEWPQDACDAYCVALATRQALHRTEAA